MRSDGSRLRRESRPPSARDDRPVDFAAALADEIVALNARLDDEQRLVLRLRHAAGLTIRQIARHLGLGEAATESRLRRATDAARKTGEAR